VNKKEINEDKIFELATDAGANDCIFFDEYYEILTNKDEIYDVKNIMEKEISNFISTEIAWVPINKIKLNQEDKEKIVKFLDILEEDDDVQNVFTNAV
jgi:transcriptional/translational regulatory protein YebC/TACO1